MIMVIAFLLSFFVVAASPYKQRLEVKARQQSTLWIYGDSISYYFHERIKNKRLCRRVFETCGNTYNWIYPKTMYEMVSLLYFIRCGVLQ